MLSICNKLLEVLVIIYIPALVVVLILLANKPAMEGTITALPPEVYQPVRAYDSTPSGHWGLYIEGNQDGD